MKQRTNMPRTLLRKYPGAEIVRMKDRVYFGRDDYYAVILDPAAYPEDMEMLDIAPPDGPSLPWVVYDFAYDLMHDLGPAR